MAHTDEQQIEIVSDTVEVHPSFGRWSVVRNGSVYGTYTNGGGEVKPDDR